VSPAEADATLRPVQRADAAAICTIYNHHVLNTIVTFEEDAIEEHEMSERIIEITRSFPWHVLEVAGRVVGYAYASSWKSRCAYRYAVESTVYVGEAHLGRGYGTRLYEALIADLRQRHLHSVIGGISLPNDASVALHEKLGFKKIGQFHQVGWKLSQWIDVGYWELLLLGQG
jgi:L-amino acid N-acyltransferase YncA